MSKRPSPSHHDIDPSPKKQTTLYAYFSKLSSSSQGATSSSRYPRSISVTPESVGIHSYDSNSIDNSSGLDKEYKEFWNAQALELCTNKAVTQKLKTPKEIEGAINTKWTLHKTELLSLLAEKS